jgi:hypothetical protein
MQIEGSNRRQVLTTGAARAGVAILAAVVAGLFAAQLDGPVCATQTAALAVVLVWFADRSSGTLRQMAAAGALSAFLVTSSVWLFDDVTEAWSSSVMVAAAGIGTLTVLRLLPISGLRRLRSGPAAVNLRGWLLRLGAGCAGVTVLWTLGSPSWGEPPWLAVASYAAAGALAAVGLLLGPGGRAAPSA